MPREEDGETYLSGPEAMKFFGMTSPITFRDLRKRHNLQAYNILGAGKALFYKKSDLEKIPRVQRAAPTK